MSKRIQPKWTPLIKTTPVEIKLYNSLTRQKERFIPKNGNKVLWYSCGPTVYDASHMGHARSYITFDILRRVLTNYFSFDVTYVMNITDIDDKIIKRARQKYLFNRYFNPNITKQEVLEDFRNVSHNFEQAIKSLNDEDKRLVLVKYVNSVKNAILFVEQLPAEADLQHDKNFLEVLESVRDPLSEYLDSKFGNGVTDNKIFMDLPRYWEEDFFKDMDALNILKPNVLTRVSEYIPEIIDYVESILKSGYAYESNHSVYFDVESFDRSPKHFYAKLVPEAYGDVQSLQEGEGSLSSVDKNEKKSANDFALWKASKPGEPWWNSPWGKGRPGWHIECSVMASSVLGSTLDIHTGGIDLKFPHHDNEIAQSEAYFHNDSWVNYFLHSGHLTIAGCKMSKSLKNFITIKDALKKNSPRQLRLAFLLHSWKDTLDYSDNTMEMAVTYERFLNEFFLNVKNFIRKLPDNSISNSFKKWKSNDYKLWLHFDNVKQKIFEALCDNIDTRKTLDLIRECVAYTNIYIRDCKECLNILLLGDIAFELTNYFRMFGVIPSNAYIGFPVSGASENELEETLMPYLQIIANFRDDVRSEALKAKHHGILNLCDKLRDSELPKVGVRLEDQEDKRSVVKLVDKETLLREKEEKEKLEQEKIEEKNRKIAEQRKKDEWKKTPPEEIFKRETDKYSKFDEKGVPTHDVNGKEISKNLYKKLQKLQLQHEKRYKEYLQS